MSHRLAGKSALVTGSTSNIGRAIAIEFAAQGAFVVVSGRSEERGTAVVTEIESAGGRATFIAADLDGSAASSRALAESATAAAGGRVDILINNAGIFPMATTTGVDDDTFDRIFAVNVKAPLFLTAAIAPQMVANGGGAIINLGSWVTRLAIAVSPVYAASKAAVETLTRSWAAEFGPHGVRVNAISPGVIHEPSDNEAQNAALNSYMRGTPAGSMGSPESIAHAAVYLASDEAAFVHGTVLDVDGGRGSTAVFAG